MKYHEVKCDYLLPISAAFFDQVSTLYYLNDWNLRVFFFILKFDPVPFSVYMRLTRYRLWLPAVTAHKWPATDESHNLKGESDLLPLLLQLYICCCHCWQKICWCAVYKTKKVHCRCVNASSWAAFKGDMHWFFLVVKVNCSSSVFNITKSIWILKNVKNKKIFGITSETAHPMICLLLQVMTSFQENKQKLQPNSLLSVESWL